MIKVRMLALLDILHRKTDEEHILNSQTLIAELAELNHITDRRSIYRDVQALKEFGYDVVTTSRGFYLKERRFSLAEIMLLISAVQAAPFVTQRKTEELIKKLTSYLSVYQERGIRSASNINGVKFRNEEVYRTIERINYGIAVGKTISFLYFKRSITKRDVVQRQGKRYYVSPYAMVWVQDRYYLISNMKQHDTLTHFRLDRIRDVRIEDMPARPVTELIGYNNGFNPTEYAAKCLNMFGGEIMRIHLRCNMELLNELFDRFGDDVPVKMEDEDHFKAVVTVAASRGFINWVCQFGGGIEILSPESMRNAVAEHIEKAYSVYFNKASSK